MTVFEKTGENMFLIVIGVYLLGWVLAVGPMLHRRMNNRVACECGKNYCGYNSYGHQKYVSDDRPSRSELHDRNGMDAFFAVLMAMVWLPYVSFLLFMSLVKNVGRLIQWTAPLTGPERARLDKRRQEEPRKRELETEKLMKEIEEK